MGIAAILLDFLNTSFPSLLILFILMTFMIINRDNPPPSSSSFKWAFALLLLIVVLNYGDGLFTGESGPLPFGLTAEQAAPLRQICAALNYILQPVIILLQLLILAPSSRLRIPCIILSAVNAAVYLPAVFGADFAFYISAVNGTTHFHRGMLGYTIFAVLMIYVILLYVYSVMYFKQDSPYQSLLLIFLVILAVGDAFGEVTGVLTGHVTEIIIISTLAYYLYLTAIHQQQMRAEVAENKLRIVQQEMTILRDQIQPHFIYNSLSIIRSLIRSDSRAAIRSLDTFSAYLEAHFRTFRHDSMIPFSEELENVRVYLSLAMADISRQTQVIYQLGETDFDVPPLCLEPIVENAILHGAGEQDGVIVISSHLESDCAVIEVRDNGTGKGKLTESRKKRAGIGVDNTRKRLQMLCGGSLELQKQPEGGTCVRILIPREEEVKTK